MCTHSYNQCSAQSDTDRGRGAERDTLQPPSGVDYPQAADVDDGSVRIANLFATVTGKGGVAA